ncbi:hypothetical protein RI054_07g36750 [Pseudoscourfieldia marina]
MPRNKALGVLVDLSNAHLSGVCTLSPTAERVLQMIGTSLSPQTDPNTVDDFAYCICGRAFSAACVAKAQTRLGADLAMKLAENEESISICEICLATSPIAVHIACTHPSLLARGSLSAGLVSIRPLIVHDAYIAGFTDLERSHAAMRLAAEDRVATLAAAPAVTAAPTPKVGQTAK